jgi:oxaloacetate decarboxylase
MHLAPTSFAERRQHLRRILSGDHCIRPGSVFDPISARLAEDLGFELGMLAGSVASFAVLGAPDLVVLTLTEFAEQVRRITRASTLPLLVDADHGYGNALNVMRTVQELELAGVAALTIEDTELPLPYASASPRLISREEGLGKIRAALAARGDAALVIVARTGAVSISNVEDAISRAQCYAQAGADALFFTGISTAEQLGAMRGATDLPIILGGAPSDLGDTEALAAQGVRVALQGHAPFLAAVRAAHETLQALRNGTPVTTLANQPTKQLMQQVTRDRAYADAIRRFLGE